MSEKNANTTGCSTSFTGLLTLLFIGLKLTGHIDWSWWWVLSPIWIGLLITMLVVIVSFIVLVAVELLKDE